MLLLIKVLAIILAFILLQHEAIATTSLLVLPVTKRTDAAKAPLYSVQPYFNNSLYTQQHLLLDLDAPFVWHSGTTYYEGYCEACPYPVSCDSVQCTDMQNTFHYNNPSCPPATNDTMFAGQNCYVCPQYIVHPITGACDQMVAPAYEDKIMINFSNGREMLSDLYTTLPTAAASPPWIFDTFPKDVLGVLALSTSRYALPAYLNDPVQQMVALCLSSSMTSPGILFLGNGPYYLFPRPNVDVRGLLTYTTLLKHPKSFGYFIGVKSVVIKNRSMVLPANTTTKISTLDPYTVLRSDIYNWVVRRVASVTKRIPSANAVAPFGLCFNMSTGPVTIANIDLALQDGKNWAISTGNSIKIVADNVACLAFVDGGATSEHGIVIGTYQIEDNFLMFNLKNSTLGFSSALSRKKTSCSFNFGY